ncbi:hypothetical protein [Fibrisoma montanum]|nr:hypothetical protein [Fibrisoma montanum]
MKPYTIWKFDFTPGYPFMVATAYQPVYRSDERPQHLIVWLN